MRTPRHTLCSWKQPPSLHMYGAHLVETGLPPFLWTRFSSRPQISFTAGDGLKKFWSSPFRELLPDSVNKGGGWGGHVFEPRQVGVPCLANRRSGLHGAEKFEKHGYKVRTKYRQTTDKRVRTNVWTATAVKFGWTLWTFSLADVARF